MNQSNLQLTKRYSIQYIFCDDQYFFYITKTLCCQMIIMIYSIIYIYNTYYNCIIIHNLGRISYDICKKGELYRLITSTFIHYHPLNIIANTALLITFGFTVELKLGYKKFLFTYFLHSIMANCISIAFEPNRIGYTGDSIVYSYVSMSLIYSIFGREEEKMDPAMYFQINLIHLITLTSIIIVNIFNMSTIDYLYNYSGLYLGLITGFLFLDRNNINSKYINLKRFLYIRYMSLFVLISSNISLIGYLINYSINTDIKKIENLCSIMIT